MKVKAKPKKQKKQIKIPRPSVLVGRDFLGLRVSATSAGRAAQPAGVYAIYKEWYLNGSSMLRRGETIFAMPGGAETKGLPKKSAWLAGKYRPDLYATIQACGVLFRALEDACTALDANWLKKTKKW